MKRNAWSQCGWTKKEAGWYVRGRQVVVYLTAYRRRLLTFRTEPLGEQGRPTWWFWNGWQYHGPCPCGTMREAMRRADECLV